MKKALNLIVAMSSDRAIGRNGDLIWHLRDDLRRFKALTMGHPVIMGRKTWESLPKGALPGRLNIVVSRNPEYQAPGATLCNSLEQAVALAQSADSDPFIIGGGHIYADTLPLASKLHITHIDAAFPDADTFFPKIDDSLFSLIESTDPVTDPASGLTYSFLTYARNEGTDNQ
ncbi:MAG: dihydrofolate reductase [Prevotella sp.]|nr:dihydrofolate reductase [Prevotella sp.]MCM1075130.1 dihydrofolate reductase [Ruminococcus sp.]